MQFAMQNTSQGPTQHIRCAAAAAAAINTCLTSRLHHRTPSVAFLSGMVMMKGHIRALIYRVRFAKGSLMKIEFVNPEMRVTPGFQL